MLAQKCSQCVTPLQEQMTSGEYFGQSFGTSADQSNSISVKSSFGDISVNSDYIKPIAQSDVNIFSTATFT